MLHDDDFTGDVLIFAANLTISFAVLFSYPLQLFPSITTISQIRHKQMIEMVPENAEISNDIGGGSALLHHNRGDRGGWLFR